jgi:hypothetical protein
VDVVLAIVGLAIVALTLADAFDTLVSTRIRVGRLWPTDVFYFLTWRIWRFFAARPRDMRRRETLLSLYGPLSLVVLLGLWTFGQIIGWGLFWYGTRGGFASPMSSILDAFYYSGVVYFSIGFGDVVARDGALRLLTILEAFEGLATLGLVIGYLPPLYAAYQSRERQLLRLDDLSEERITPATLAISYLQRGGLPALEAELDRWCDWCADVFETHTSFPMLMYFRSQHPGHSWVTGLGVIDDTAVLVIACLEGADRGPAMRLHRQTARTFRRLAERIRLTPSPDEPLAPELLRIGYDRLAAVGLEMRPFDEAFETVTRLRAEFHPPMEAFIEELAAPRGFWGVTSAETPADAQAE